MKKTISLLLALVLCLSLCACGGESNSEKPNGSSNESATDYKTEVLGEWYDIKTSNRLVLNSDGSLEHYKDNFIPQPGNWTVDGNVIDVLAGTINNDLTIVNEGGTLSLTNDEFTFVRWESVSKENLSVGEKGQKENIAITMTSIVFTTELPADIVEYVGRGPDADTYKLQDGMVYAKITLDVSNLSKQEINIPGISLKMDVMLDYNNGFRYATHDNAKSYFVSGASWAIHDGPGGQTGSDIPVQPLQSKTFDVYIACPEIISTDTTSPLLVGIIASFESEVYYYEYKVR